MKPHHIFIYKKYTRDTRVKLVQLTIGQYAKKNVSSS